MASRESVEKLSRSTHNKIVKHLSGMGIAVAEIDSPSNEGGLYSLQALQAIESALDGHTKKSSSAENLGTSLDSFGASVADSKKAK
jgi:hypothetical protein